MILRTIVAVLILTVGALVIAGFLAMCEAKQEAARPEGPLPKAEKPLPEKTCEPPILIQFWVFGKDGKLKLSGQQITLPGTCVNG